MYISTVVWRDLTDGHLYQEGDKFPFDGREIAPERLEELQSAHNRAGFVLIRASEVKDEREEDQKQEEPKVAKKPEKKASASKGTKTRAKKAE